MPRSADELTTEVTEILSSKDGLSRDVIDYILDDIKGHSEDVKNSQQPFLDILKEHDADFIEEVVHIRQGIGSAVGDPKLNISTFLMNYLQQVRPN